MAGVSNSSNRSRFRGEDVRARGLEMKAWLMKNLVVVRDIEGPGCPSGVADLKKWHVLEYGQVPWGTSEGMYRPTTLVDAIGCVRRRLVSLQYLDKLQSIWSTIGSLREMLEVLKWMKHLVTPHPFP